jgi:hypothetical protein
LGLLLPVIPIPAELQFAIAALDPHPTHTHFTRLQRRQGAMNPDTKMILDKLHKNNDKWEKRIADLDTKWEARFSDADDAREARIKRIKKVVAAFEAW